MLNKLQTTALVSGLLIAGFLVIRPIFSEKPDARAEYTSEVVELIDLHVRASEALSQAKPKLELLQKGTSDYLKATTEIAELERLQQEIHAELVLADAKLDGFTPYEAIQSEVVDIID